MRCYFLRHGHIAAVEILEPGDDAGLIDQSKALFEERRNEGRYQGFEVWDGARRLYRSPESHGD